METTLHAPGIDRLRSAGPFVPVIAVLCLWMWYSVNGFRPLTAPITLSDENSGGAIRQLVFLSAAGVGGLMAFMTRSLDEVIYYRLREGLVAMLLMGSLVWSTDKALTAKRSIIFVCGWVVISVAVHMTHRPARLFQRTVVRFCGFVAWVSILGWFALPRNCVENPARGGLAGVSNHPNTLAPYLVLGFILSLGLTETGRARTVLRFLQVGMFLGTFMTGSMTSVSMILAGAGIFFFINCGHWLRGLQQLGIGSFLTLLAVVGPLRLAELVLGAMGRDTSLSGRDQLWAGVWGEAIKRPLFGHGYGAFWYEGRGREIVVTWNPRQSHNALLDVFTDLGLLGVIAVLLWFYGTMFTAWLKHETEPGTPQRACLASLMAVIISTANVFGNSQSFIFKLDSFPFFVTFWCLMLLGNTDRNHLSAEFSRPEDPPKPKAPQVRRTPAYVAEHLQRSSA